MKKQSRLTALLLALCMLMSTLPVSALADGILTLEDYLSAVQRVQQELSEPSIPVEEENAYTLTRTTATETIVRETVTGELSGEGESAFTLPLAGKLELSTAAAADAYQWQIDVGGVWANIVGDTAAAVTLTYAKVQNALSGGTARVRCAMTQDGQTVYSAVAAVTVDETVKTQTVEGTEEISAVSYTSEAPKSLARTLNAGVGTYANEPVYKYYIRVYYQFENGDTAAQTYEAEVSQGSDFPLNLTFPTVTGYLPYVNGARQDSINQTFENIQGSHDIYVTYKPTEVNYTVKHYLQNADDDEYTLDSTVSMQGLTASTVSDVAKTYEGFYALVYEKPAIAADGSTVVKVYYDRYYYLMSFNLDGGYGVEPIYARYGAPITGVGTPTKAGYSFVGWSLDGKNAVALPSSMPAANKTYKALWKADATAKVTVVFWGENADDEEYSYIRSMQVDATPGASYSYDGSTLTCPLAEHSHGTSKCTLNCIHVHTLDCYSTRNGFIETDGPKGLPNNGDGIYTYTTGYLWPTTHYYLKIGDKWYCGKNGWGSEDDTEEISPDCKHTHTDACYSCGSTEHTHSSACSGLWTFVESDTVTVAADGSSVVNVYYDRTKFTLKFRANSNTVATITEKWGADIHTKFPIVGTNGTTYKGTEWKVPNGCQTFTAGTNVLSIDTMPSENITFTRNNTDASATLYYYVESLDGTVTHNYNGKNYDLYKTVYLPYSGRLTESEEFHEIIGFTKGDYYPSTIFNSVSKEMYLYYTRNSFDIVFYNPTELIHTEENVPYQKNLSSYVYTPTPNQAPAKYEPGSVEFEGWYLNPECSGQKFDFSSHTMPAGPTNTNGEVALSLYAKWVPVTHKVEFYLDKAALDAGTKLSTHPDITVPHGSLANPEPADPKNGGYTFVGWFYMEDGVEKAFDFANMPVNKDLKVYGKWSSNTLMPVIVYFKYMDGETPVGIAAPVEANPLAGTTVTFDAKGGTDLYTGYQDGYFPVTKSHSMVVDINKPENAGTTADGVEWVEIEKDGQKLVVQSYTFWYKKVDEVPYTVHYVTDDPEATGEEIVIDGKTYKKVATTKTVENNTKAVVTEVFEPVPSYMPDAYQKRLVLSVTEDGVPDTANNVIVFYYTKDNEHAYYSIKHYREIIDNNGNTVWEEYARSQAVGIIGQEYSAAPMKISGYTYDSTVPGTLTKGVLTADAPLELKFYYRLNRTSLTVTKEIKGVVEPNASFVFRITGYGGLDLKVVINGEGSVTIDNLIANKSYTVEEVSSNWRYKYDSGNQTRTLEENPAKNVVTITNKRTEDKWLDSNAYSENVFDAVETGNTENGNEGGEQS